jgi:uncharacterized protein YdaU (DUF1376 family)
VAALPYLRVYCADWDADTQHLTAMQDGIYWRLVRNYWQRGGPLPADEKRLARIARVSLRDWRKNSPEIADFFQCGQTHWHHRRLDLEISRVAAKSLNNKRPGNANATRNKRVRDASETRTRIYTEADTDTLDKSNAASAASSDDPVKQVFDLGCALLTAAGTPEKQARSLLGKWRKAAKSDGEVITALIDCRARAISEPVEWLQKRFNGAAYVSASGHEYRGSREQILREAERRNDMGTYWQIKRELADEQRAAN